MSLRSYHLILTVLLYDDPMRLAIPDHIFRFICVSILVFLTMLVFFAGNGYAAETTIASPEAKVTHATAAGFTRDLPNMSIFNVMAHGVQKALTVGIPSDSLVLILFIPLMAMVVVFFRYIVGVATLGIAPTIVVALTLFVTGLVLGLLLFGTLLLSVFLSRILFKRLRIMQLTKVSLSMLIVSLLTIFTLSIGLYSGLISSGDISIFPILVFMLLSERIVAILLEKKAANTLGITFTTLLLGIIGFYALSQKVVQNILLSYPEIVLLVIPVNWFIGRYFGLRLTEYFRFVPNIHYGNK
jgi:hypothetical protein